MNGMNLQGQQGTCPHPPAPGWHAPPPAGAPGHHYPQVPPPAGGGGYPAVPPGYPAPQQSSVGGTHPGHTQPASGWSASAGVQLEHAQPGMAMAGHYGHLQHAPSFNTAAGTTAAAFPAAGTAAGSDADANGWVLTGKLPAFPSAQLIGPMVRFGEYELSTGSYELSVLVVSHPSLGSSTVQLHWGFNGPAMTAASSHVLDEIMGFKFYRFDISVQLTEGPSVLNYLVGLVGGQAPLASHTIHLPARWQPFRWLTYSCNGFHEEEPEHLYGGIGNLWRDVMARHTQQPFHLQVGGGDQLYCDQVFELPALKSWLAIDDPHVRAKEPFTPAMLREVEQYYFGHYCRHFGTPEFATALAAIPFIFNWDDHDIFDGWGSYPDYLQKSAVFQGMFAVARRFYLLFQQHARYDNAVAISKTIGEFSYHLVRNIGPNVILLSPDTRSERTIHQVLPPQAWDTLFREVERRLAASRGAVQHLVVLLPVPIVYPKIPVTETALAAISNAMASRKDVRDFLSKLKLPSGAVSQFNEPDLLDDLLDHWTSTDHVQERQMLVRRLQGIAAAYSIRVTFISGDVHVGAFGCFQAHPKQHIRVVDPKFMLQVISSAIGNEPPPQGVITALETTSMATTSMVDTLDKMLRTFGPKGKLKGARNYCEVSVMDATTCSNTGAPQPPGGLAFTLRVEVGPPGRPTGIETFTQVAPVLLAGPRAAEAGPYTVEVRSSSSASGVLSQVAAVLPGNTGQQVQQGLKTAGHKLANLLARV